jgi:hypothetical protein
VWGGKGGWRREARVTPAEAAAAAVAPQYEGRQVSRIVQRTVFFDKATLLVTVQPAPRSGKVLAAVAQHIQQQRLVPCSQVWW